MDMLVSQGILCFSCGRNVGANVDYTRRLCLFGQELLCYFKHIMILFVVCPVLGMAWICLKCSVVKTTY